MFCRFFIERPVFSVVVSIFICMGGIFSLFRLAVEQYPQMTPVQVMVSAQYPGADAATVARSVAAPIENEINGIEKMLYMNSTSSASGALNVTVFFEIGTDPDMAQVQVQNRINQIEAILPEAVRNNGISVSKQSSSMLMLVGILAKGNLYSDEYVTNYANVHILEAIKRIPGAGDASVLGTGDQAMRIWLDPDRMAQHRVTVSDVSQAVSAQNSLYPAGEIGSAPSSSPLTYPVIATLPYSKPDDYGNMIVRAENETDALVRIKDIASVAMGKRSYEVNTKMNGQAATFLQINLQTGANALDVSDSIRREMDRLSRQFPDGIRYVIALDTADYIRISIEEVFRTLVLSIGIVIAVIYLFLQKYRATLIASSAILVALLGTFGGMYLLGFSINLLTLFGMVLSIGLVVDDAIIVVENVERNMRENALPGKKASIAAMKELTGPIVATVLVLTCVFVPAAFVSGTYGELYRQFAITIAISVAISGFVALTLTPALCGIWLNPGKAPDRGPFAWFNRKFATLAPLFEQSATFLAEKGRFAVLVLVILFSAGALAFGRLPQSFVPLEDEGYLLAAVKLPDSSSLYRTDAAMDEISDVIGKIEGIKTYASVSGFSLLDSGFKTSAGTFFMALEPFSERYRSLATAEKLNAEAIMIELYRNTGKITSAEVFPVLPPVIPGLGTTGGFEFWLLNQGSASDEKFGQTVARVLSAAQNKKELSGINTPFSNNSRQLKITVDREKARLLGLDMNDITQAIGMHFASTIVSQFTEFSRVWYVVAQSAPAFRVSPEDITRLHTRNAKGEMVPLSAVVSADFMTGPDMVTHFNGVPAAKISGSAATGFSSGQAMKAMEEIASENLPDGYSYSWSGISYEQEKTGNTTLAVFIFSIILVFLILAAQYEDLYLPAVVLSAVPFGVVGSLLATWLRGLDNDVYFQIGLLVIVGLAAKNAILIVEFARRLTRTEEGDAQKAAIFAGKIRLRPVIMTSLAFIGGVMPLALATGAGANARHAIGTGIIGGMLFVATIAFIFIPLFYKKSVSIEQFIGRLATSKHNGSSGGQQ